MASHPSSTSQGFHTPLNAVIILATATFRHRPLRQVIQRQPETEAREFPARAVGYFQQHPLPDPSSISMIGAATHLEALPKTHVFIDGRADLYGPESSTTSPTSTNSKAHGSRSCSAGISRLSSSPRLRLAIGCKAPRLDHRYEDSQAIILTKLPALPALIWGQLPSAVH